VPDSENLPSVPRAGHSVFHNKNKRLTFSVNQVETILQHLSGTYSATRRPSAMPAIRTT
jgi:hypothetical protein